MLTFIVIVLFGAMFLCTGLFVNLLQAVNLILILPFSRRLYRSINYVLMDIFWAQLVWLVEWWGRLEIRVYTEPETWAMFGKEHAIVSANHRSDVDWAVGWVFAQRGGCLGGTRALMKREVQFLPVIGWSMWFSEYTFLARNWAKDQSRMQKSFESLQGFPKSMWLAIFLEGTRFTEAKLKAAQEYAASAGLPIPRHTLVPRTKGFVTAVKHLRAFVPAIYDMTVMVPEGVPRPTFFGLAQRKTTVLDVHIQRVPVTDLPEDDVGIADWARKSFIKKESLLDEYQVINSFPREMLLPMKPSVSPALITAGWAVGIAAVVAYLLKLAVDAHAIVTWTTIAWVAGGFLFVGILMQWFLSSTQSERSTVAAPARQTQTKTSQQEQGANLNSKHPHAEKLDV